MPSSSPHRAEPAPGRAPGTTRRRAVAVVAVVAALGLLLAACGGSPGPAASGGKPLLVVTTSVWGDVVSQIVGDQADVSVLMPRGADPHEFEASASQAAQMRRASLVIANGLGLEEQLKSTLDAAASDGVKVLEIGPKLDPQPLADAGKGSGSASNATLDPHVWMDPQRVATAAPLLADQIAQATGLDKATLEARAAAYAGQVRQMDQQVAAILAPIPAARRTLVTNHDALGYFARRYDLTILGAVIPGGSTLAEPSAAAISTLANQLRQAGVTAVFSETTVAPTVIDTLAKEVGSKVKVVELYTGSLGPVGSDGATYLTMMTSDAHRIADALTPAP